MNFWYTTEELSISIKYLMNHISFDTLTTVQMIPSGSNSIVLHYKYRFNVKTRYNISSYWKWFSVFTLEYSDIHISYFYCLITHHRVKLNIWHDLIVSATVYLTLHSILQGKHITVTILYVWPHTQWPELIKMLNRSYQFGLVVGGFLNRMVVGLCLPVQAVHITTKVVSSNPGDGEVVVDIT